MISCPRCYLYPVTSAVTLGAEAAGGVHDVLVSGVSSHSVLAPVHLQVRGLAYCCSKWCLPVTSHEMQNPRWHDPTWAEGGTLENITFENYVISNAHTAIYINLCVIRTCAFARLVSRRRCSQLLGRY